MSANLNFETVPLSEIAKKGLAVQIDSPRPLVLVVDDEHVIADTLATILIRSGYDAVAAYNGEGALETSRVIRPELLITDVHMPGITGIDLAIAIQKSIPECKVLLFSGQASTLDLLASARDIGYDFTLLLKPIHPTDLLASVSACIPCAGQEPVIAN
jgi:DNA-binding response OmpR family regulator